MRRTWLNSAGLGTTVVVVTLVLYMVAAIYPFDWEWPAVPNAAEALPSGGFRFAETGIVRSRDAPSWVPAAMRTNRLEIMLRVRSFSPQQEGPARIMTLSSDLRTRNFTVGQDGSDMIFRLRTPWSSVNGTPAVQVPGLFAGDEWVDLRILIQPNELQIAAGDKVRVRRQLPPAPLELWDPSVGLALGNELTGDRPWRGEISRALIRADDSSIDYLAPGALEIPVRLWYFNDPQITPFQNLYLRDVILNLAGFVPLGLLVAMWMRERDRGAVWRPLLLVIAVSASLETLQLGFPDRNLSVNDLIFNTIGGGVGIALAYWMGRYRWVLDPRTGT